MYICTYSHLVAYLSLFVYRSLRATYDLVSVARAATTDVPMALTLDTRTRTLGQSTLGQIANEHVQTRLGCHLFC